MVPLRRADSGIGEDGVSEALLSSLAGSAYVLGSERPFALAFAGASVLRLESRHEMLLAVADQFGAPHPMQRLAQLRPVVGVVIAQKCLVQTTLLETFDHNYLFAIARDLAQR